MKNLWYIAKKDLMQIFRDRASLIFLLLVPLVLIIVIGFAFGNTFFGSGSSQITITVAVNNQDSGSVGKAIVDALHINTDQLKITVNQYSTSGQVTDQVANNSNVNAGVVIPTGTTDKIISTTQSGTTPKNLVQFYSLPGTNDARITVVQNIVSQVLSAQLAGIAAVGQIYSVCNQPGNHCAQSSINAQTIATTVGQASAFSGPSTIQALTAGKAVKINTFDQLVPGYAIFFALFLTFAQLTFFFVIGYFAFHLHIGSLPAVIALMIGVSFAATGLGILLVSAVKTRRQLSAIVPLVVILSSAIGGAWWPLFIEPAWMQQIAKIGITAWAMEGLNGVMILGKDFAQVAPDILGLFAYGLIQEKTA